MPSPAEPLSETPSPPPRPEATALSASPMMAQYLEVKRAHPDCLLFYRMGDFYEMFFEDAVKAAKALDIALTKRGRHEGEDIPMCGVPVHAADAYLSRLIRQGFRVAVCEQMEDPAEARRRGGKAVVRREVIRIITPGTLTEDSLLDARRHNYLAALAEAAGVAALAWLDLSTGDFHVQTVEAGSLAGTLARLEPGELILSDRLLARESFAAALADWRARATPQPSSRFDSDSGRRRLEAYYRVKALDGFGSFGRAELAAAGALLDYVELTQKGKLPRFKALQQMRPGAVLEIDPATRRNLELASALSGERRGSLLAVIDRTVTAGGARLLAARLAAPLTDPRAISDRLDMVEFFASNERLREEVRKILKGSPDLERALSRLALGRGGPRDLAAVRDGLRLAAEAKLALADPGLAEPPAGIATAVAELGDHEALVAQLAAALAGELPLFARDGGFIASNYHPALDNERDLARREPASRGGTRGALSRRERHRLAQDPAQQRARLLHRGDLDARRQAAHGCGRAVHPPPDHGGRGALHHGRACRARGEDRARRRQGLGPRARALR